MSTSSTEPGVPVSPAPVLNIANALTVLRIVLVPVFCLLFFADGAQHPGWRIAAFIAFVVAMGTDYVDGYLARKHNLVTDFGKLADPIADKALLGAAMVSLSVVHELFWWVTLVILVRELGITIWRLLVVDRVVAASPGGKLKTVTQSVGVGMLILPLPYWVWPAEWLVMGIAIILTVTTGIDYLIKARTAGRAAEKGAP